MKQVNKCTTIKSYGRIQHFCLLSHKATVSWFLGWRIRWCNENTSDRKKSRNNFFLFWPPDPISRTTGPTKMVNLSKFAGFYQENNQNNQNILFQKSYSSHIHIQSYSSKNFMTQNTQGCFVFFFPLFFFFFFRPTDSKFLK